MKKFILLLLAFMLLFAIAGCTDKPATNSKNDQTDAITPPTELALLQSEITKANKLLGIAYLGWLEGDMETACTDLIHLDYTKDLPFIKDIDKNAENDGYRMYLLVPADDSVSISVCKCEFNDEYLPHAGEELVTANEPILIRGNMSDTIPNLYVVAERGSEKTEYTPAQSGMDSKLENSKNLVYDFTPYDLLPEFIAFDRVPDAMN